MLFEFQRLPESVVSNMNEHGLIRQPLGRISMVSRTQRVLLIEIGTDLPRIS
jgi:hypothetical protein